MRIGLCCWLLCGWVLGSWHGGPAWGQAPSATAAALRAIFNPTRAPQAKAMGLFQANFLDAVPSIPQPLQLAVVIDSTESMSLELGAIRETLPAMFGDLARIHDGQLGTTVVTFADLGASAHPARALHRSFVSQPDEITALLAGVQPESGRPYFPEAIDLGVFTALDQLEWSPDAQVQRWILVVGDAPPYDAAFDDPETHARRWYDTQRLVDLANQKGIQIHCLLCPSRETEQEAYLESLAKSRQFLEELANGTGGRMLDLSYPVIRQQLLAADAQPASKYTRIGYVSDADLALLREGPAADKNTTPPTGPLRVAVLPLMSWESLSFAPEQTAVQLATELRQRWKRAPGLQTVAPRQIEDELSRLRGEGLPPSEWPAALCWRLRCDYLLHGELRSAEGEAFATLRVYGRDQPQPLVQFASHAPLEELASTILRELPQAQPAPAEVQPLLTACGQLRTDDATGEEASGLLASLEPAQRGRLLAALEGLEQALEYPLGDPQAEPLLTAAAENLQSLLQQQPELAFGQVLQASAAYNLAEVALRRGDRDQADQLRQRLLASLKEAYRLRTQLVDRLTRLEVQADYALMVSHDPPEALERYREIVQFSEASPLRPALRAHWMLLAMQLGAWQIEATHPALVQPEQAREHLLKILAFWPTSSEAAALKRFLLWDEKTGRSRTPFLPVDTQPLGVANNQ